jgi:hypothetical protein
MSLTAATLIPGILLLVVGLPLALVLNGAMAVFRAFPRSQAASYLLFGVGAAWFLYNIAHLSPADFGDYKIPLFIFFGLVAIAAFKCVPDFLAVRGAAAIVLLAAEYFLGAAFMEYQYPQRLLMVTLVYLAIALAIWLGAQPWRLRDFLEWLFRTPGRTRTFGLLACLYGLILCVTAFTY